MPDKPQVPVADEIVRPAIDKLVSIKPAALKHINYKAGVWSHIFAGLRTQAITLLRRLAKAAAANRLPTSTGSDLLELVDSEFFTLIDPSATIAVGEVLLTRTGTLPPGVIPKGTRFSRAQTSPNSPVALVSSQYVSVEDVYVDLASAIASVRVAASQSGAAANHVAGSVTTISIVDKLFDTFAASASFFAAAGGADGVKDADAVTIAKANAVGQFGPTDAAIYAGGYAAGARHMAVADDPVTGVAIVWAADTSWASSDSWLQSISKSILDKPFQGFGCVTNFNGVDNKFIHVVLTVLLRDPNFMTDTLEVRLALQKAIRAYFDDRADWYTWTSNGLQAAATRAHSNILVCTDAEVVDVGTGLIIDQPVSSKITYTASTAIDVVTGRFVTTYSNLQHLYLSDNGVTITFLGPI